MEPYIHLTDQLIDKLGDLLQMNFIKSIHLNDSMSIAITTQIILANDHNLINFRDSNDVKFLLQLAEKLYFLYFDLPLPNRKNYYDLSAPYPQHLMSNPRFKPLSSLLKPLVLWSLKNFDSRSPKLHLSYPKDQYPTLHKNTQQGGHLYNPNQHIIFLTKEGPSRDPYFASRRT